MPTPKSMTRQEGILAFVRDFQRANGYSPSVREIGQHVGISSTSLVMHYLRALARQQRLQLTPDVSRGIHLLDTAAAPARQVPVVGTLTPGEPLDLLAEPAESIVVSPAVAGDAAFAVRVRGDALIEECIADGDLVIVRPGTTPRAGDLVLALCPDAITGAARATLLRRCRADGALQFQPTHAGPAFVDVPTAAITVRGTVAAVIRSF